MVYKFLIFSSAVCLGAFSVYSAEIAAQVEPENVVQQDGGQQIPQQVQQVVDDVAVVKAVPNLAVANKTGSKTDSLFNNMKNVAPQKNMVCQECLEKSIYDETGILDLSKASDFEQNGLATIKAFLDKVKETNFFGTGSKNISIDLTETNVSPDVINQLIEQIKAENYKLILNLSFNKNINDGIVDSISSFQNIYGLVLRGTGLSDAGVAKINAILETSGIGDLHSIDISETKISDAGAASLENQIKNSVNVWKAKNPNATYKLEGKTGVIYEKALNIPFKSGEKQVAARKLTGTSQPMVAASLGQTSENSNQIANVESVVAAVPESQSQISSEIETATQPADVSVTQEPNIVTAAPEVAVPEVVTSVDMSAEAAAPEVAVPEVAASVVVGSEGAAPEVVVVTEQADDSVGALQSGETLG